MDELGLLKPVCLFEQLFDKQVRLNGTEPCDAAAFSCSTGVVSTAAGSSIVTVGTTNVICGVKVKVLPTTPHDSDSLRSNFVVNVEHLCLSYRGSHRTNLINNPPPSKENQFLAVQLNGILSSVALPDAREQLRIPQQGGGANGGACYIMHVDVVILHDDGCLLDACLTACLAAIVTARWPRLESTNGGGLVEDATGLMVRLKLSECPIAVSFAVVPQAPTVALDNNDSESTTSHLQYQLITQPSRAELLLWDIDASPCYLLLDSHGAVIDFCVVGGLASGLGCHLSSAGAAGGGDIISEAVRRASGHAATVREEVIALTHS